MTRRLLAGVLPPSCWPVCSPRRQLKPPPCIRVVSVPTSARHRPPSASSPPPARTRPGCRPGPSRAAPTGGPTRPRTRASCRSTSTVTTSTSSSTDDVVVSVTYLDSGTGTLELQYDAAADPAAEADDVQLTNTGQWQTGTFALTDIGFTDRLGGADLRLSGSADITVAAPPDQYLRAPPSSSARPRSRAASPRAPVTGRRASSPACRTGGRTGRPTGRPRRRAPTSST